MGASLLVSLLLLLLLLLRVLGIGGKACDSRPCHTPLLRQLHASQNGGREERKERAGRDLYVRVWCCVGSCVWIIVLWGRVTKWVSVLLSTRYPSTLVLVIVLVF